ncbi:MAG: transglycosylase family protein [Acidimicrobiia bacterium]
MFRSDVLHDAAAAPKPRRGSWTLRLVAMLALVGSLIGAGGSLHGAAATPGDAANSVRAFGGAPDLGPAAGLALNTPILDVAAHPNGNGYWLVSSDGGVFTFGDARFLGSTGGMQLRAPVVGIAAARGGNGYWLVASDGGVFTFGDAPFYGSLGGLRLNSPILSITATPSGRGYWLAAADGGVFAFGDAQFHGSATGVTARPVISMAATRSGNGYYLLASDGGVFTYGDAGFRGALVDPNGAPFTAIATSPDGMGYWVVRQNGAVHPFGVPALGDVAGSTHPAVGIATRSAGGYWVAQGKVAPAPAAAGPSNVGQHPFLVCTRARESRGNYRAVNPSGTYRGAYQFSRSTWNSTARHAGRNDLVNVDPAAAAPADQDFLALHLYQWQGASPWLGRCAGR